MARHTRSHAEAATEGGAPEFTERHLTVLRKGASTRALLHTLRTHAGIRGARAADFRGSGNPSSPASSEAVLYEKLGVAVINGTAEQIALARLAGNAAFGALHRERLLRLPAEPGEPHAKTYADTSEHATTWGLQSTRVDVCKYFGSGTRVCVLDSGIEPDHPDIRPELVRSFTPIDDVRDRVGHGTHCAGTIAGARAPARGPRYGVACETQLFVAKVFDTSQDWSGSADGQLIAGINWAVEQRCDVVSMSFGAAVPAIGAYCEVFEQAARSALDAGTLLIASAGNDSQRLQEPPIRLPLTHPANCPSIMAVGALDADLDVLISSNAGEIDLVAPGANIHSAWPSPARYARRHGTSMAVPFVAGIAALWAEATGLRGRALWNLLLESARPLRLSPDDVGRGLVQAP
jgi:subtilisin family serine protease